MHPIGPEETNQMLRITTEKKRGKVTLTVEGRLSGGSVGTLEKCWRELRSSSEEGFPVEPCSVSFIEAAGKILLRQIPPQGRRLPAEGCLNQAIVNQIAEEKRGGKTADERDGKDTDKRGSG